MLAYACRFEPVDQGFVVTCRDLPEVVTQGDDLEEATVMAVDAIATVLSARAGPTTWPEPSQAQAEETVVSLPPLLGAKVALWASMNEAHLDKSELGRRLGISESAVRRLLDFKHRSHIAQLEAALAVLGKRLVVEVRDAA